MNTELINYYKTYFEDQAKAPSKFFTDMSVDELPKLLDIDLYTSRLTTAIELDHKICIFSDYDTDAVSSTAVIWHGLQMLGVKRDNLSYYAPDRFRESYGMNLDAVKKLDKDNDIILTVDCGITSTEEAEHLASSKTDLLITDHHQLGPELPNATAVINPQRETEDGLTKSSVGASVAWFSLIYLAHHLKQDPKQLNRLLPFVATAIIADCQSIVDPTNRILTKAGLQIMTQPTYPGLEQLLTLTALRDKSSINNLDSQDLGYIISPILNSPGRISHANLAIDLLTTSDRSRAKTLAQEIVDTNQERKNLVKESIKTIDADVSDNLVWTQGDYHKGIIGLIASRLTMEHGLPSIVVSKTDDGAGASLRAPEGYDLAKIINDHPELFTKGGGHKQAAGFSAEPDKLESIKKTFQKELIKSESKDNKPTSINITEQDLTPKLLEDIWTLDPFSQDFPMPLIESEIIIKDIRLMGSDQNHAKLTLSSGLTIAYFNLDPEQITELQSHHKNNKKLTIQAKPSKNIWNNTLTHQLIGESLTLD